MLIVETETFVSHEIAHNNRSIDYICLEHERDNRTWENRLSTLQY